MKPNEYNVNIPKEKFTLVNENKVLHDKELVTKPVGFLKDAFYRFSRNKGSIVGAAVVGLLVAYALIAPIFSPYTVSYNDSFYRYTLPKVFNDIDFLDGCAQKTLNEESLLYYYSMGVETGHNAIKRQEYTKNSAGMYSFRLDSYQSPGTIFIGSMPEKDYFNIQDYQDRTNRQVIYPITEISKRPVQAQDKNNANYWFTTEVKASKTVASNYTIEEDGSITYTNIYLPYAVPRLLTTKVQRFTPDTFVKAVALDNDKFALCLTYKDNVGNFIDSNYIAVGRNSEDKDFFFYNEEIENAAAFSVNPSNSVLVINLTGHENVANDGDYYLAIPDVQGSAIYLRPLSDIDNSSFAPLKVLDKDTGTAKNSLENDGVYCLSIVKDKPKLAKSYISGLVNPSGGTNGFNVSGSSNQASYLSLGAKGDGYTLSFYNPSQPRFKTNLVVTVNPDDTYTLGIGTIANATVFLFDETKGALYTTIEGHTDVNKNGNYYLTSLLPDDPNLLSTVNNSNYKVALSKAEQIDASELIDYYRVLNAATGQQVNTIDTAGEFVLCANKIFPDLNYFYLNGSVDGDNYFSKMRIEGEDEYQYSYAIAKGGHSYEVRVNYYEYYRYYHQEVLKDRITEPSFLFGTTSYGQDIFTCLASGARFSFMLAIVVAFVNMIVGAIYGAIEGYYGGKIDLIMERIVEILSAVPFMIVITLLRYHMRGTSQVLILFIAFFLTGWIGMSSTVRMQFYRFKNQEYVLASRTLGARDWRIMFKHIFPNSLGTIVTSSVLVIPGMIFSETSLSYLGIINLGTGSMTSVGTLLAAAQPYLVSYPHMIFFPALFISMLMLCFNLFGNGLRDAFNPSLRGTED